MMMSNFACAAGALFIVGAQEDWHRLMGLFVCLSGAVLSLGILITSDRGQKSASMGLSYAVALALAGGASLGLHAYENQDNDVPQSLAQLDPPAPEIPAAVLPDEAPPADAESPEPEKVEEDVEEIEPEKEAVASVPAGSDNSAASVPRSGRGAFPASTGSTSSTSPSRSTPPPPVEEDWDDWEEDPEPVRRADPAPVASRNEDPEPARQASSSSEGVPLQVLDTMLRSNRGVKSCFVDYRNQTGQMPSGRITVSLTVESSGSANSVRIDGGEYAGTSLDSCLSSAIRNISFPPFSGSSKTYRYPFML